MSELLSFVLSISAGFLLGGFFFGGLWWTVQKGVLSKSPALWFFGSLLIRMSILLTGFYFVGNGHWPRMAFCLLGFILARTLMSLLVGPIQRRCVQSNQELVHAP